MEYAELFLRNIYKLMLMNMLGDTTIENMKIKCLIDCLVKLLM